MTYKYLLGLLIFIVFFSCTNKVEERIEKWDLYSFEGNATCSLFFEDTTFVATPIMGIILGFEDSTNRKTKLHLHESGELKIVKDNQIALVGSWLVNNNELLFRIKDEYCKIKIVTWGTDTLTLQSDAYPYMSGIHITLLSFR